MVVNLVREGRSAAEAYVTALGESERAAQKSGGITTLRSSSDPIIVRAKEALNLRKERADAENEEKTAGDEASARDARVKRREVEARYNRAIDRLSMHLGLEGVNPSTQKRIAEMFDDYKERI